MHLVLGTCQEPGTVYGYVLSSSIGVMLFPIPQTGTQVPAECGSQPKVLVNGGRGLGTSGPTLKLSRTEFFSSSSPGPALLI